MLCKQCGAQIRKQDLRPDGVLKCPECGKLYRVKNASGAAPAKKAPQRKKKKQGVDKRLLIGALALLLVVVLLVIILVPGAGEDRSTNPAVTATPEATATIEPTPVPTATPEPIEPASVHFRAVGDIMSHKLQLRHYAEDGSYDPQFQYVKEALSSADYTIGNLELSIALDDEYSSWPFFRTPEAILATLKDCGVDMLTNSNNHILDSYWDGLVHTVNKVEEYGFDHIGAYRTPEEAEQLVIKDINGIKFGFIAYTIYLNENEDCLTDEQASFAIEMIQTADIEGDVKALKDAGAEVIIALPHWGKEETRNVGADTKEYARRMVESGVDIILGSHSHMVQPMGYQNVTVDGKAKRVFTMFSLGNFISTHTVEYTDSGIILDFTINEQPDGTFTCDNVQYIPTYCWMHDNTVQVLPSGRYINNRPANMDSASYDKMVKSYNDMVDLIGPEFSVLGV